MSFSKTLLGIFFKPIIPGTYNGVSSRQFCLASFDEEIKPEFQKALKALSKGDELVVTKLDRAFSNKNECIRVINKLLNQDVQLRTLSGFFTNQYSPNTTSLVFNILCELNN